METKNDEKRFPLEIVYQRKDFVKLQYKQSYNTQSIFLTLSKWPQNWIHATFMQCSGP